MVVPFDAGDGEKEECTTEFALRMSKWVHMLVFFQFILGVIRFWLNDFWGAVILLVLSVAGSFVFCDEDGLDPNPPMQLRGLVFWGVLCVVQGVAESLGAVHKVIHFLNGVPIHGTESWKRHHQMTTPPPGASSRRDLLDAWEAAGAAERTALVTAIVVPVILLLSAVLVYLLFMDWHNESEEEMRQRIARQPSSSYGATVAQILANPTPQKQERETFVPFQGKAVNI
eukprot:CAMPEP_0204274724 /NCGR_PEP_ID=MMETSP0468-20130131/25354_1 /ASSEMBLY_ACC=CAM_ASM_000383 /TAXON_ID=2969 /ORGANISM="Oxyrrhis marina" /LENGTH=227 /DNA_ID=CAMNT_0051250973 /DNA_START=95 /DNA_END=778 /DNA_ORIENTATION=+